MKIKVAINGFGRIGRILLRQLLCETNVEVIAINDHASSSVKDFAYLLKYDSIYGTLNETIVIEDSNLILTNNNTQKEISTSNFNECFDFISMLPNDCIVVDCTGNNKNYEYYKNINQKVIVTTSNNSSDIIIDGIEKQNCNEQKLIFSSICDAVAIVPIINALQVHNININSLLITILHPVLSYQKVLDSFVSRGVDISLGRQFNDSLIPKNTSLEEVLTQRYPNFETYCFSYRIPSTNVCSADITFSLNENYCFKNILEAFNSIDKRIVDLSYDSCVSIDFKQTKQSSIIDMRWTKIVNSHILKTVIWYDNEWGYCARVVEIIKNQLRLG